MHCRVVMQCLTNMLCLSVAAICIVIACAAVFVAMVCLCVCVWCALSSVPIAVLRLFCVCLSYAGVQHSRSRMRCTCDSSLHRVLRYLYGSWQRILQVRFLMRLHVWSQGVQTRVFQVSWWEQTWHALMLLQVLGAFIQNMSGHTVSEGMQLSNVPML